MAACPSTVVFLLVPSQICYRRRVSGETGTSFSSFSALFFLPFEKMKRESNYN